MNNNFLPKEYNHYNKSNLIRNACKWVRTLKTGTHGQVWVAVDNLYRNKMLTMEYLIIASKRVNNSKALANYAHQRGYDVDINDTDMEIQKRG